MPLFDIDVRVDDKARLVMSADTETRNELREALASGSFWTVLSDMLESHFTNGAYRPFDASIANPFVGLTMAPCIAEFMDTDDDGTQRILGRLWFYPDHMLSCPIETLIEQGQVVWALAGSPSYETRAPEVAAVSRTRHLGITLRASVIMERYIEVEVPADATDADIADLAHQHFKAEELEVFTPDVESFAETEHVWEELKGPVI